MSHDKFYEQHKIIGEEIKERSLERFKDRLMPQFLETDEQNEQLALVLNEFLHHFDATWSYLWGELELDPYDPEDAEAGRLESCQYVMGLAEYFQNNMITTILSFETENPEHEYYVVALSGIDNPMNPFVEAHQCTFQNMDPENPIRKSVKQIANIAEELKNDMCDMLYLIAQDQYMTLSQPTAKPPSSGRQKAPHLHVVK